MQMFSQLFGLNSFMECVLLQIDLFLLDMTLCALYQFRLFIVGLKLVTVYRLPIRLPAKSALTCDGL